MASSSSRIDSRSLVAVAAFLVAPTARADFYASLATGVGVSHTTSGGTVQSFSPERAATARYSASILGVGPVGQLALGAQWPKGKLGGLLEAGYYRGHSWGSTAGLERIGSPLDSSTLTWFWGLMGEGPLASGGNVGVAAGFSGFRHRFEGAPAYRLYVSRAPFGTAVSLKVWLAGEFNVDLGPSLRLGWRCPVSLAWSWLHRIDHLDPLEELGGPYSVQWLFELKYR